MSSHSDEGLRCPALRSVDNAEEAHYPAWDIHLAAMPLQRSLKLWGREKDHVQNVLPRHEGSDQLQTSHSLLPLLVLKTVPRLYLDLEALMWPQPKDGRIMNTEGEAWQLTIYQSFTKYPLIMVMGQPVKWVYLNWVVLGRLPVLLQINDVPVNQLGALCCVLSTNRGWMPEGWMSWQYDWFSQALRRN